jgi:hypothetical protein
MAAARKKKDTPEVSLTAPLPGRKPRKRFYMQKMPDGVGERAVRAASLRSGAREQTVADFFGSGSALPVSANQRSMESLLGELLSELDLQEESLAPELLADAWLQAVGAALASVSRLAGVARGRARISVSHPSVRYEITRLKPQIIRALNKTLGMGSVKSLSISGC